MKMKTEILWRGIAASLVLPLIPLMLIDLDDGVQMTCLRCGFNVSIESEILTCPSCQVPLSSLYTNPEDFCRECQLMRKGRSNEDQEYRVSDETHGAYSFDVSKINSILESPSCPKHLSRIIPVPDSLIFTALQINVTEPRHYPHIPQPEKPGVLAEFLLPNGKPTIALIDGSHRAAIALQSRKTFYAYQLAWPLVQQIITKG